MFGRVNDLRKLFLLELGAALSMERTVLALLDDLEAQAKSRDVKELLLGHAQETRDHADRVEQAFRALGEEPDEKSCPGAEGIAKGARATVKKASDELVDIAVLGAVTEAEHHEIAAYEQLVEMADAQGWTEASDLVLRNLEDERRMLRDTQAALRSFLAQEAAARG
jgi:ferritin-like metal-binding protein YciE